MAYKDDLRLAFSGKEIASQRIEVIDSTTFENETAEQFSRGRRVKYQNLLEKSNERIAEIKSRIVEDIGAKKIQLKEFQQEVTQVNTRYKLGEVSYEVHEKIKNDIRKKFDKVKAEGIALQKLYEASTSSEIGGRIPIDIDNDVDSDGNINRKKIVLNIPSDIKIPNIDALSDIKVPNIDALSKIKVPDISALPNLPNSISTQGRNLSREHLIALVGAIGVIIAILFISSAIMGGNANSGSSSAGRLISGTSQMSKVILPDCRPNACEGYEWNRKNNL